MKFDPNHVFIVLGLVKEILCFSFASHSISKLSIHENKIIQMTKHMLFVGKKLAYIIILINLYSILLISIYYPIKTHKNGFQAYLLHYNINKYLESGNEQGIL